MSERIEDTMQHHHHQMESESPEDARAFWDARYGEREQIWSGAANQGLRDVVTGMAPGRALDLGCGEGADSIWLAEAGWHVTGIDISDTALSRAHAAADARGIPDQQIDWMQVDLAQGFPEGAFDLVSACFLASPIHLPRADVMRRAAGAVASGGTLLVVSHAAGPPWAGNNHGPRDFPSPAEELSTLDLDQDQWDITTAEIRTREATGPDGERGTLQDTVVVARRR